jgi:uncharacterized protein YjiS (DUF1127 family)
MRLSALHSAFFCTQLQHLTPQSRTANAAKTATGSNAGQATGHFSSLSEGKDGANPASSVFVRSSRRSHLRHNEGVMGISIANRGDQTPEEISRANLLLGADGNSVLNGDAGLDVSLSGASNDPRNGGLQHLRRKPDEGFVARAGTMGLSRGGRVLNALAYMQATAKEPLPFPREDAIGKSAHSRVLAVLVLPATWWRRAHFRAQLRDLIEGGSSHLRDAGFDEYEARTEAARFFWEPVMMKQRC